jgi:hypothetical protein
MGRCSVIWDSVITWSSFNWQIGLTSICSVIRDTGIILTVS